MARGRDNTPDEPASGTRSNDKQSLANQQRLLQLGDAVDQRSGIKRRPRRVHRHRVRRRLVIGGVALVVVIAGVIGGSYYYINYRFDRIHRIHVAHEIPPITGKPFNILMIGSDSRAGLSGLLYRQTGANSGTVDGQRSDVVKIVHVDPDAGTIAMLSIPRDTVVTLLANQSLYGRFNRINVNFGSGPGLLAQTITANFGIPINQTIVVSFAGMINAADAIGGVYLDFPYPAFDPNSGLRISHSGCQLVTGFQALAITRSRHYFYNVRHLDTIPEHWSSLSSDALYNELINTGWLYDGSSDFGRIFRQNAFLRAMIDQAKKLYNPLTLNKFLSAIPQGVTLDANFSLHELLGLAVRFHSINPNSIQTYTMQTVAAVNTDLGDVLYVQQPYSQEQLVSIFGSQLERPTNPPPNAALQTPQPPTIAVTTTTVPKTTTTKKPTGKKSTTTNSTTTTTNATLAGVPGFDPRPCTP